MANFGVAVGGVEDLDGDGRGEVLVGAGREDAVGISAAGNVHVFSGAAGGLFRTIVSPNPRLAGRFGSSLAVISDVNGDETDDFVVGAPSEGVPPWVGGRAYVFSGATGASLHTLVSPEDSVSGYFGGVVAAVPDTDGDGAADVLVGAPFEEEGGALLAGHAYLFSGATGALLHTLTSPAPEDLGRFGRAVGGVPDADGDGRGDLLVGALDEGNGDAAGEGRAHLFSGATGELLHTLLSPTAVVGGIFGVAVFGLPDGNGDGRGDLLVGAPFEPGGAPGAGQAHLYSGADSAYRGTLVSPQVQQGGHFGFAFALVSGATGNGAPELLVGASSENGGAEDAGRAHLFAGLGLFPAAVAPDVIAVGLRLSVAPSPARSFVTFTYSVPVSSAVRIAVFDLLGREVTRLVDGPRASGEHRVRVDLVDLPAGVYLLRLEAAGATVTRKLVVAH